LTLFNGSPRGRKGNTPIMLEQFGTGFTSQPGNSYEVFDLNRLKFFEEHIRAFAEAECVWLGFPLYVDSMPGMVKTFIEALEPFKARKGNPPMGFLVQNGFPEAHHCRYVESYLQKLVAKLGSPYLGTIVKGGGEGVRMTPEEGTADLFEALQGLGKSLAQGGRLDPDLLAAVVGVERYPAYLTPVFKVFTRLPIASMYWDTQLKENKAYEQRYAQPYLDRE
jgi:multimeric flavodoxin WrbA